MKRSLIAFQALLASSAVLCQSAEATSIFNAPDQTNNTVEARIDAARNGNWESLLKNAEADEALVAKESGKTEMEISGKTVARAAASGVTARAAASSATAATVGAMAVAGLTVEAGSRIGDRS